MCVRAWVCVRSAWYGLLLWCQGVISRILYALSHCSHLGWYAVSLLSKGGGEDSPGRGQYSACSVQVTMRTLCAHFLYTTALGMILVQHSSHCPLKLSWDQGNGHGIFMTDLGGGGAEANDPGTILSLSVTMPAP